MHFKKVSILSPLHVSVFIRLLHKRAPPDLGFGRGLYKRKNERFFPPRKCQGGALLFSPCYRGICPSDIKQACMFQKGPRGSANFFIFFKKKTLPSLGGFFLRQKRKSPRGSANPGRKKGRRLHQQFGLKTIDLAVQSGCSRSCPDVPGCAQQPDPARSRFLPRRSRGRHS